MQQFEKIKDLVISKLEGELDLSWEEICDTLDLDLNPHELRKRSYGIKAYDDYLKDKEISQTPTDIQKEIDDKLIELRKEKIKLNDIRTQVNKEVREQARFENLLDLLREEIGRLSNEKPLMDNRYVCSSDNYFGVDRNECILALSDLHFGIDIDNSWNKYNSSIAKKRMKHMVEKTIRYGKMHDCKFCHGFHHICLKIHMQIYHLVQQ